MAAYFTKDTDRSIEAFQRATTDKERNQIFDKEIRPAFEKLIESVLYVYRFWTVGDPPTLQRECLTDLYKAIPKFDASKSSNPNKETSTSFSYFNIVTRNWFVARTREIARQHKNESDLLYDIDHENAKNSEFMVNPFEVAVEEKERWIKFYEAMDSWRGQLKKKNERQVLEAIIFIFKNSEMVSIYNKKAVYLYLRELTGLNTKQIVVNLKRIRSLYDEWYENYHSTGDNGYVREDAG